VDDRGVGCVAAVVSGKASTPIAAFVIKAEVRDPLAKTFVFAEQKTMYGGKRIAPGDTAFVFASETQGGAGLVARGIVREAGAAPRKPGTPRQTPRVRVVVTRSALAKRALGRRQLSAFNEWRDGRPETELNFKFYRQATNKIGGISAAAAEFLNAHF
jgi:hypothetical protein